MRTTIDLPDDLHELAREMAHRRRITMSAVVAELIRRGLETPQSTETLDTRIEIPDRGLPRISLGRPITAEDVIASDEEADA